MSEFISRLSEACNQRWNANIGKPLWQFVTSGDRKSLETAKKQVTNTWSLHWFNMWNQLGPPAELSEEEKRAMEAAAYLGVGEDLARWLKWHAEQFPADDEAYLAVYLAAFGSGHASSAEAASAVISEQSNERFECSDGRPNAIGRFLLALSDDELSAAAKTASWCPGTLRFLLKHSPGRLPRVARDLVYYRSNSAGQRTESISAESCRLLLDYDKQSYYPAILDAVSKEKDICCKALGCDLLAEYFPDKHMSDAKKANLGVLKVDVRNVSFSNAVGAFQWLLGRFGASLLPEVEGYFSSNEFSSVLLKNLELLASQLGPQAAPAFIAAATNPKHDVRTTAIENLMQCNLPEHDEIIVAAIVDGFASKDSKDAVRYINLAGRWQTERLAEPLWKLFEHKSKPVREAAARVLGRLGDAAVDSAAGLLVAKKAAVRSAAVSLLTAAQTPAAAKVLEDRLDDETDEEVRDQILLALDHVWEAQGKKITRKQIDQRIARTAEKLKEPAADWIDEKKLPPLCFAKGGEKLGPQAVRYLLYRQSRAREMQPDIECKPLYALIDRETSGDFALAVLQMFLASKMAAEDRWALAVAGILGDDRVVTALMNQIRAWVDANRGKLAEYAAQALALLGSDVALCAVDALSIRYRSKQKNIGKAAAEAFAEAAERQGLTVDELGDRVVPWLGFVQGKPRLIEQGDKQIEIRIGSDFKLEFRDLAKGKKIASLPSWVPADVKNEYKDLGATLREVLKGQLVRIENLMVRQFRWPVERWQELFLVHPVLFPFATRLVWGIYDAGQLQTTFRALEDRTLTNAADEAVSLPGKTSAAMIGIVHPLELSADDRKSWATHLADYTVQSPFLQLERPVVYPTEDEKPQKMSSKYEGTKLNAMTFKGRAERLGWQRGSVCDGGGITSYHKSFPGAGAEVILDLDGMYIGIGMDDSIDLGRFCFVKSGSVSIGSYVYDEPRDAKDPRLLSFGDVPPIVFSETLGDLGRIAGTKEE